MLPARTIRLRLTLWYGGFFLLAGALLVTLNFVLVSRNLPESRADLAPRIAERLGITEGDLQLRALPPRPGRAGGVRGILIEDVFQSVRAEVRSETLRQLLLQSGVALGVMAVISMGLGWVVAGRALRPLHDISATVRRISDRNLDERVALAGPRDEVRELADQFDVMLDRLQAAFEAQREFVANASHELRTPLTIMRTELDVTLAADRVSQEDVRRMAEVVRRAIDRSERLIDRLLVLATAEGPVERSDRVDLGELARASLDQRSEAIAELDLRSEVALGPAPFAGNGSLVERLVDNLVENAIEHNVHGGLLAVTTATDAGEAVLRVENDGAVIAPDEAERMFDRFARLGRSRSRASGGYGLGLSIVRAIARSHGGTATVSARDGGGLEVAVRLPL